MTAPTPHRWEWRPNPTGIQTLHCDDSGAIALSAIGSHAWRYLTESLPGLATLDQLRAGDIDQVPAPTPAQIAEALDDDGLTVLWQDGTQWSLVERDEVPYHRDRAAKRNAPMLSRMIVRADPPSLADRLREWADCISPAADADLLREAADALDTQETDR